MAWTVLATYVGGQTITSAWLNGVVGNFNETAPAKATTAGYHFVSTGANSIAERAILSATVNTSESTASTSYVDLTTPGPTVTATTGAQALVWFGIRCSNSGSANASITGVNITGATTLAPNVNAAVQKIGTDDERVGVCNLFAGLTAGSNTFSMQYRVVAGTGSFSSRHLVVMAL